MGQLAPVPFLHSLASVAEALMQLVVLAEPALERVAPSVAIAVAAASESGSAAASESGSVMVVAASQEMVAASLEKEDASAVNALAPAGMALEKPALALRASFPKSRHRHRPHQHQLLHLPHCYSKYPYSRCP